MSNNPIRLSGDDLFSPKVEGYLEEQAALRRIMPEAEARPLILRILFSSYFYLSVAGAVGAFAGWALLEPFLHEGTIDEDKNVWAWELLFAVVASFIGMFLGAIEGIMSRNLARAAISSLVGLGIGLGGGLLAIIPVKIEFAFVGTLAMSMSGHPTMAHEMPRGLSLLVLMMGRGLGWAIAAIPAGLGQGIALREKKVAINGLLGAVLGGLLGGLLFDPITLMLKTPRDASASRGVGFVVIGILVGLFVGLVEQWSKTAWFLMKAGPLAGKQFILYRNPTVIGSSPKADIYIFKDPDIEPKHALLHNRGGRFEIEDCGTRDGTYVNGQPVKRAILKTGDQVVIGKTMLEFSVKETA